MSELDAAAHTPPTRRHTARMTALIVTYILLGLIAMGLTELVLGFNDPCGPFAASSQSTPYTDFSDSVRGGFGFLYLAGSIPLAIWRRRKIAWLVVVLTFLVVTAGAIAVVAGEAPAGTYCDLGAVGGGW